MDWLNPACANCSVLSNPRHRVQCDLCLTVYCSTFHRPTRSANAPLLARITDLPISHGCRPVMQVVAYQAAPVGVLWPGVQGLPQLPACRWVSRAHDRRLAAVVHEHD